MTELLDKAVEIAESATHATQDEVARMMLLYLGDPQPPVDLTADEEAAVMRSRDAANKGEFASEGEMQAIWAKYQS